jgi:hypothetical protein
LKGWAIEQHQGAHALGWRAKIGVIAKSSPFPHLLPFAFPGVGVTRSSTGVALGLQQSDCVDASAAQAFVIVPFPRLAVVPQAVEVTTFTNFTYPPKCFAWTGEEHLCRDVPMVPSLPP